MEEYSKTLVLEQVPKDVTDASAYADLYSLVTGHYMAIKQ